MEAAQLHIKELREALQACDRTDSFGQVACAVEMALAKQPNTRALDKALLEARIDALEEVNGLESWVIAREISDYREELAELNKE